MENKTEDIFGREAELRRLRHRTACDIFNTLAAQYGRQKVLAFVEHATYGITADVVLGWLANRREPGENLQNRILLALQNFKPDAMRLPIRPQLRLEPRKDKGS